ncbi:hypothetical protein NLJ89_g3854 [Agrocybe chaxingu]|uniref:Uncharacterized protein n=1 Tax=Agrocybe chaxingu TaxID=84603 RepID=A0A9W8K3T8_9AGAR|nr:hypothetical protein NLJ89_g3854 [Agrocybe chaxingu]
MVNFMKYVRALFKKNPKHLRPETISSWCSPGSTIPDVVRQDDFMEKVSYSSSGMRLYGSAAVVTEVPYPPSAPRSAVSQSRSVAPSQRLPTIASQYTRSAVAPSIRSAHSKVDRSRDIPLASRRGWGTQTPAANRSAAAVYASPPVPAGYPSHPLSMTAPASYGLFNTPSAQMPYNPYGPVPQGPSFAQMPSRGLGQTASTKRNPRPTPAPAHYQGVTASTRGHSAPAPAFQQVQAPGVFLTLNNCPNTTVIVHPRPPPRRQNPSPPF